ncbi:Oxidoreductase NAD-binding [Gracilaria domingensis]|nr:Oxidoreductase NAD-binding [Gracilaria domingensis]
MFTFSYPSDMSLSFKHTEHVKLVRPGPFKPRSYTPTSESSRTGSFDLVLKIYPGGTSEWLDGCAIGSRIVIFGPLPLPIKPIVYNPGRFVVVIALGIGLTKGFVCAREELRRNRFVTLMYSVRYKEEAIFLSEIAELQQSYPRHFTVKMIASREKVDGWTHGRPDETYLSNNLPEQPKDDTRILVVGTKDMIKSVWKTLGKVGYTQTSHALSRKRLKS